MPDTLPPSMLISMLPCLPFSCRCRHDADMIFFHAQLLMPLLLLPPLLRHAAR